MALCTLGTPLGIFAVVLVVDIAAIVAVALVSIVASFYTPKINVPWFHRLLFYSVLLVLLLVLFVDDRVLARCPVSIAMPRHVFLRPVVPQSCWYQHRVVVILFVVFVVILVVLLHVFVACDFAVHLCSRSLNFQRQQ